MENREEIQSFKITYSAKRQSEIERIRNKYVDKGEDKMEQLRRLDSGVTKKANTVALIIGVVGALVLGFGMSLTMSELSLAFGLQSDLAMLIGIIIGIVGIVLAGLAYPLYNIVLKREREKIAPLILRLTDELMK